MKKKNVERKAHIMYRDGNGDWDYATNNVQWGPKLVVAANRNGC